LIRPVRYILLSDAVIENVRDEQIEAVFGHEAGHVRHHHILFLFLFLLGSGSWFSLAGEFATDFLQSVWGDLNWMQGRLDWIPLGIAVILGTLWFLIFGWVSRRFERQADVHAAKSIAWQSPVAVEEGQNNISLQENSCVQNNTLDYYGASVTAHALERIAMLNGMSIHTKSWRHSSIASRMDFLRNLASRPGLLKRFENILRWIKIVIVISVLTSFAAWWLVFQKQAEMITG